MKNIQITRDILIAGKHTETDEVLAVGTDIDAETAARLVREGAAIDPDAVEKPAKASTRKPAA